MVMNLEDLKRYMQLAIVEPLDHKVGSCFLGELTCKNLDLDVPELKGKITTTENLAVFVWQKLHEVMLTEHASLLFRVEIQETPKNTVIYEGE